MNNLRSKLFKTTACWLAIFASTVTLAQQDFQGVATYQSKTTIDLDKWGGEKMSPERKKMIMERMKSMFEKTFILTFNRTESTYKEEEKLGAPGSGGGFGGMMGSFTPGIQYKNVKDGEFLQDQEFFGKQFLIKDKLEKLEWKMTGETKQIGQYMCMKATAIKKVDEMDFSNMRRKNRDKEDKEEQDEKVKDSSETASNDAPKDMMDEIEIPEDIEVVVWYTMQIPVNQGPGEFWGLPGLILEASSGRTTVLCSKIVLNPGEKEEIKKPTKGKEVTKQEYTDIVKQKVEEMREMYGGRNRGQRRN
ncbi:GLPGLI family protein [Bizionia gelidisalsuginis]|uniref:GLPGLI family protein n=2 Tax=Bizionia TaxID=283785 RepID=A0A8H2LG37_9FLAO|nr:MULTISPECIES: GLPGLI family protein [Bizionia]TYB78008.1 GLPGLI family protein [Bizionia saleffrena]TYC12688.1 GLPGLI family protein [Bizionia gelidisalsuginis]